jgi:hypothetical protein
MAFQSINTGQNAPRNPPFSRRVKVVATEESVRAAFAWEDNYPYEGAENPAWAAEFDRWLEDFRERAFGAGYDAGYEVGRDR